MVGHLLVVDMPRVHQMDLMSEMLLHCDRPVLLVVNDIDLITDKCQKALYILVDSAHEKDSHFCFLGTTTRTVWPTRYMKSPLSSLVLWGIGAAVFHTHPHIVGTESVRLFLLHY